ncbi:MAG: hypothetical protein L0K30_09145, partial [Acidipropionibacterium jensenii]
MSAVDEIDLVAADDRPTPTEIREAVHAAIERCAKEHGGLVHISLVRAYLEPWQTGPQVGAAICHMVRAGRLVWTGEYAPNGNTGTRNALRPAKVYRLAPTPIRIVAGEH